MRTSAENKANSPKFETQDTKLTMSNSKAIISSIHARVREGIEFIMNELRTNE